MAPRKDDDPRNARLIETLRADVAAAEGPQIEATEQRASKAFSSRKGGAKAEPKKAAPAKAAKPTKRKRGSK